MPEITPRVTPPAAGFHRTLVSSPNGLCDGGAHLTAVEAFAPFAALVVVAHLAGWADAMTGFWAMAFFWLRLTHAVVYLFAIPFVRKLLFTLGFACIVGIFWQVIRRSEWRAGAARVSVEVVPRFPRPGRSGVPVVQQSEGAVAGVVV